MNKRSHRKIEWNMQKGFSKIVIMLSIAVLVIIVLLIVIGYAAKNNQDAKVPQEMQNMEKAGESPERMAGMEFSGMTETSSDALIPGEHIIATGTENDNGTVSAVSIIIGEFAPRARGFGTSSERVVATTSPRTGFQRNGTGTMQTIKNVSGEILEKDSESITVKLEGGGSIFVFYSEATKIFSVE